MRLVKLLSILIMLSVVAGCAKSTSYWKDQMKSPESAQRLHAVHALRDRVKEANVVVPVLMDALKDEDPFIRRDAARALGKFGVSARDAIPALNMSLSDKEPSVRKAAAQSFMSIDPNAEIKASR